MGNAREQIESAIEAIHRRPRHLVLAAAVAGLLLGPLSRPAALVVAALLGALARRPGVALLVAAATVGGAVAADARLSAIDRTRLGPLLGTTVRVEATLLERPRASRSGVTRSALVELRMGEKAVLRATRWPPVEIGAIVVARGRLEPLGPYDGHRRLQGAHALLRARDIRATGRARGGLPGLLDLLRSRAERALSAGLPVREAALAWGMVLGQDDAQDRRTSDEFRAAGLSHLLAASGQNIVLLATLAMPLLALSGLSLRARLASVLALIAVYVPIAGAGPSIQRAGAMGAAGVIAGLAGRPSSRAYGLLLAAFATLLLNPRAAADPGWQLSFAAVVSIFLLTPRIVVALAAMRVGRRIGVPRPVAEAVAVTIAATAGTAPLIALHFERISLASLPANLLAAPAVVPITWLGLLASAIGQAGPAALPAVELLDGINAFPLAYIGWVAHVAAGLPGAELALALPSPLAVVAAYAVMAALVIARRARRVAPLAALVLMPVGWTLAMDAGRERELPRGLELAFLDIGQGDATLLRHGSHAILVDAGPPDGPILDRLRDEGVTRLDALVVTHAQADHEGGAAQVLERHPVGLLVDGGDGAPMTPERRALLAAARRRRVPRVVPAAGQRIRAGPLVLDIRWPPPRDGEPPWRGDPNQRAVVAIARDGSFAALLTADAESDITAALDLPVVDALKVAHHGSADAGLPQLLRRVQPEIAVIEVGRRNSYGHPTPETLAALRRGVPTVLRTDRDGTVRLTQASEGLRVSSTR